MKQTVTGYGRIKRIGNSVELKINGKIAFNGQLCDIILNGKPECGVIVTVKRNSEPKSNEQLKYYFGVVVPYCMLGLNALGWRFDQKKTDQFLRKKFFVDEESNTETGEIESFPGELSKATILELSEYIEEIIQFAEEDLGVKIPQPEK